MSEAEESFFDFSKTKTSVLQLLGTVREEQLHQVYSSLDREDQFVINTNERSHTRRKRAFIYTAHRLGFTLVQIANVLGYRDHTTPLYHFQQGRCDWKQDSAFRSRVRRIGRLIQRQGEVTP